MGSLEFVASLLLSGLTGVFATIAYQHWSERGKLRLDCFRTLMRHSPSDDEFLRAFTEASVVFYHSQKVREAQGRAMNAIVDQSSIATPELIDFLKACADDLGMHHLDDRQLRQRFGAPR